MKWAVLPMPLDGPLFEGAIGVYGDAFALPPYSDPDRGREVRFRLQQVHSARDGYRGFIAAAGDTVLGMTYGYTGKRGQWWHDVVEANLSQATAADWLADSYELVEIAVAPRCQGNGIGAALILALLEVRPEASCVLSTRTDSDAHRLYRRMGFEVLTEMAFASGGAPFYIMGKRLAPASGPAREHDGV